MKYSIKPCHPKFKGNNRMFVFEDGVQCFQASAVELEFWARIQELEKLCVEKEERINKLVFEIATWGEILKNK